eukprot:m.1319088 g.1319088  ORF g.1319088 m.1319088 type:complete len:97 (+) comp24843_c0_seq6:379-669(+)
MGDRIFDTSGTHCMEFVCNLVRAAHRSQQLRGAKVPVLCRSEIVHQVSFVGVRWLPATAHVIRWCFVAAKITSDCSMTMHTRSLLRLSFASVAHQL